MNIPNEIKNDKVPNQPIGVESYPEYDSLWHLAQIGIFDGKFTFASQVWDLAAEKEEIIVALIDTPVAWDHPCLQSTINRGLMVDYSTDPTGVFPVAGTDYSLTEDERTSRAEALRLFPNIKDAADLSATRPAFSGHGTAMAGLIGAKPAAELRLVRNARYAIEPGSVVNAEDITVTLPYAGVNPFCQVVPISTTSDPDPELLTQAFNYAIGIGAHVIAFATTLIAPDRVMDLLAEPHSAFDRQRLENEKRHRGTLEDTILEAAQKAWVVCAAGNSGSDVPEYPASLSIKEPRILAVGAVTSSGTRAPYSSNGNIWAPSNDESRYDRSEFRTDKFAYRPQGEPAKTSGVNAETVSVLDLVSTDVPGPFGYNPSQSKYHPPREGPHLEVNSLFCRFGGTSGATAIVAGLIALALQMGKTPILPTDPKAKVWTIKDLTNQPTPGVIGGG
jgi:subtilisin family serine protease